MSGDVDYLMKVIVPDIEGYDRFYKKLIRAVKLTDVPPLSPWSRSNTRRKSRSKPQSAPLPPPRKETAEDKRASALPPERTLSALTVHKWTTDARSWSRP